MRHVSQDEVQRAVLERPEYPQLRADVEEAYAAIDEATQRFLAAQQRVSALYEEEAARLIAEAGDTP